MVRLRSFTLIALTIAACVGPASQPRSVSATTVPPSPTETAPTPGPTRPDGLGGTITTPSPTAATSTSPVSAGAVPDAGVVFMIGGDDAIHRYDGATGTLMRVWARSTFGGERTEGVYVLGRHGGAHLLGWDGSPVPISCGTGIPVSVAATGACASVGNGIEVALPGEAGTRQLLPADWLGAVPTWSPDARSLLVIRTLERRPGPGMDPGLSALWVVRPDGTTAELYRPPGRGVLSTPVWSPDGTKALVRQIETTSNSFAADGVGVTTLLIDVVRGTARSLGTIMHNWSTWSADGQLAFVRGGGRQTWWEKDLIVLRADGVERSMTEAGRVAIAPAWGPSGTLGWVSGPAMNDYNGNGYIDGGGAGHRVGAIRIGDLQRRIVCGDGRVVEGLRWSGDGEKLLLLCRKPGRDPRPLELWLSRLADDTTVPLVTGLPSHTSALGFGYYGAQPPITSITAWSIGLPRQ